MHLWGEVITGGAAAFLFLALAFALGFEAVNGFHDTANAVATVIYTHSLKPNVAVVWSGIWNFLGVLTSTGAVAYSIVALLPIDLVINIGSHAGFAMVFALLISAIIWNLGTWYFGLPCSSSHTLIGAIIGVGLAHSLMTPGLRFGEGVNWGQARNVGLSLIVSPLIGFVAAALLLLLAKALIKQPELYETPEKDKAPPLWIRSLLVFTCTGVSFAHGSNDGQKGMGLFMLILIGVVPGAFALKMDTDANALQELRARGSAVTLRLQQDARGGPPSNQPEAEVTGFLKEEASKQGPVPFAALARINEQIDARLNGVQSFGSLASADRQKLRNEIYLETEGLTKIVKTKRVSDPAAMHVYSDYQGSLSKLTKYIPVWVKMAVAVALGLGTMVGWKRIVITVGEKIGKSHLTYAQGACAELVTMCTIEAADRFGLPASTTHVLSSGVAGAMFANRSGLQTKTLRNLLLAWVLTLPVCIFLGAALFAAFLYIVIHYIP